MSTYAASAKQYAERVVSHEILTCEWVQKACKRQLDDLARFKRKCSLSQFNPELLDRYGRPYRSADNRYRRKIIKFSTEMDGFIPSYGERAFTMTLISSMLPMSTSRQRPVIRADSHEKHFPEYRKLHDSTHNF